MLSTCIGSPYSTQTSVLKCSFCLKCRPIGINTGKFLSRVADNAPAAKTVRMGPVLNLNIYELLWLVPSGNNTQPKPLAIPEARVINERPLRKFASSSLHPPRNNSAFLTTGCTAIFLVHQPSIGRVTRSWRAPNTKYFG